MAYEPSCPLCRKKKITNWYYSDEICYVCDCSNCHQPMIVLKHHGEPTERELEHMEMISKKLFPDKRWRGVRRQIQQHWHEHFV